MIRQFVGVSVAGSLLSVGLLATTAGAAGTGYGGTAPVASGVPGNFTGILIVEGIPPKGKIFTVKDGVVSLTINVPRNQGENCVLTSSTVSSIKSDEIKNLPPSVTNYHAMFGSGILLSKNSKSVKDTGLVVITLKSSTLKKGDFVVEYSSTHHYFVPAPRDFARVENGTAVVKTHTTQEFVILGPKH